MAEDTRLFRWRTGSAEHGVIGGTIGAPFAVLVAEELFALGCRALVSISGIIADILGVAWAIAAVGTRMNETLKRG